MAISEHEQVILTELEQQFVVARRRVVLESVFYTLAGLAGVGLVVFAGLWADNTYLTVRISVAGFVVILAAAGATVRLLRRDPATDLPLLARPLTRNRHDRAAPPGRWPM
jgi:hypothetical protein